MQTQRKLFRRIEVSHKTFYMLNSVKHEILNAHKYKISRNLISFLGSNNPRMLFSLLINVKMPTIVGILTFMSRKKNHDLLS